MNILDLTPEYVKTAMLMHRIVLFPNGYGLSIVSGPFAYGDGVNTFEVGVIKHKFKCDNDVDYFGLDFSQFTKEDLEFHLVYPEGICSNDVLSYVNKDDFDSIVTKVKNL